MRPRAAWRRRIGKPKGTRGAGIVPLIPAAFRRGLATSLHEPDLQDVVIQVILRHSNVSVTRASYIKNDGVDPQSLGAMEVLESGVCNQHAVEATQAEAGILVKP
jgi:hypothetical protein